MRPYDRYIYNEDGSIKCEKVGLLYIEGDSLKLCDGCDIEKPNLASICAIGNNVICICKDCLQSFIKEFPLPKINKILTPFEETMHQIELLLNTKLKEDYYKIKVEGTAKPKVRLLFTIFDKKFNYHMVFHGFNNFRMYRKNEDQDIEMEHIFKYLKVLEPILSKYINI